METEGTKQEKHLMGLCDERYEEFLPGP